MNKNKAVQSLERGKNTLSKNAIIICSIVRDCAKNLKENLQVIDELCDLSKEYSIIIFENDSKDNTKEILTEWAENKRNVFINTHDFNVENTIPILSNPSGVNPYYSEKRIEKMVFYRNQYLEFIEKNNMIADFIVIVDLDVAKLNINGILDSFGQKRDWDSISSNGYSLSPKLSLRYHDSFALVECGLQDIPQTEKTIKENQYKFSFLKKGTPLMRVFSAFGGLSIYRFETVKGLKYKVISNNDKRVEVRCEHFSLNKQIHERGYNKFYINPNMLVKYQKLSFRIFLNRVVRILKRFL